MDEAPRYVTLRDYLAVLRRQRLLIVGTAVVFALAAFVVSDPETRYTAEATVQFRDITNLGTSRVEVGTTPEQQAASRAVVLTRPEVTSRVKQRLATPASEGELAGAVTAGVTAGTNLVVVQATWSDPEFTAGLANEYARQAALLEKREQLGRIDRAIAALRRKAPSSRAAKEQVTDQIAGLETLKRIGQPSTVEEEATVPTAPSSSSPARNAVLAGLGGLLVGILLGFVRDALDRRIRGPAEAREQLGFPILAGVRAEALGSTGISGDRRSRPSAADLESFRVLRANLAYLDSGGPVRRVLVTSGLPEEGRSTVAASLAGAAAAAGQRVLLLDGDLRQPALAERLRIEGSPGLAEYLAGEAEPEEIVRTRDSLAFVAAGRPPAQPADLLASDRLRELFGGFAEDYELVVIDSSPLLSCADALELVPHVDAIVVCVRLARTTRQEAGAVREALERLPRRPTGLVVTGVRAAEEELFAYHARR